MTLHSVAVFPMSKICFLYVEAPFLVFLLGKTSPQKTFQEEIIPL